MNAAPVQFRRPQRTSQAPQDFRSLEVRESESSIELIRHAATRQVRRSRQLAGAVRLFNASSHVASILAAAYRLMDPRRRTTLTERVSLSPLLLRDEAGSNEDISARPLLRFDAASSRTESSADRPAVINTDPTLNEIRGMLAMIKAVDNTQGVA